MPGDTSAHQEATEFGEVLGPSSVSFVSSGRPPGSKRAPESTLEEGDLALSRTGTWVSFVVPWCAGGLVYSSTSHKGTQ